MGADRDQLRFECTDGADDVGDRGALLQYERGEMVRMDMGAVSGSADKQTGQCP
jgi:hypothetical protein